MKPGSCLTIYFQPTLEFLPKGGGDGAMGPGEVCSVTSFCSFKEAAVWPLASLNVLPLAQSS